MQYKIIFFQFELISLSFFLLTDYFVNELQCISQDFITKMLID